LSVEPQDEVAPQQRFLDAAFLGQGEGLLEGLEDPALDLFG
jgi:hypothetical protein